MIFASGAEAVAHYYRQGYMTLKESDDYRSMINEITGHIVRIFHTGFLEWKAVED
jgi:hypothetical protein